MNHLNTFACTVGAIHSTGLNVLRCEALGTRDVYVTDDFGSFLPISCLRAVAASMHGWIRCSDERLYDRDPIATGDECEFIRA